MKDLLSVALNVQDYLPLASNTLLPWLIKILVSLGIIAAMFLLRKFLTRKISGVLRTFTKKSKTQLDDYLILAFEGPLRLLFLFLGIYLALLYLPLSPAMNAALARVFRTGLIILVSLGFYNLAGNNHIFAEEMSTLLNIKIDKILVPFLSKIIKFIIIALALTVILQEWDYDINGILAGLGLGGLAFALGAQQTLANLFGGIVIITDKPFTLGDWILTPSVEGTVEDINFRSTKVRTFAQAIVTVPNATLANEPITNWSRRGKRQVSFSLGVAYDTPQEKLQKCLTEISAMLQHHPGIHPETILVSFDSFKDSNLNIFLYFFTKTTDWAEFLQVKEDVNLKIMNILEHEGVSLALPRASLYIAKEPVSTQESAK